MPRSPIKKQPEEPRQPNGISPVAAHLEAISPFSQPPAPPPQQPLPEKPDSARFMNPETANHFPFRRTETERPKAFPISSTGAEPPSGQILALVEALNTARKEIDTQGDRVKQLETLLRRERKARESAEERARRFMAGQVDERGMGVTNHDAFEPTTDKSDDEGSRAKSESNSSLSDIDSITTITAAQSPDEIHRETQEVDASTTRLQERLEQMVQEMSEMKAQMESYKRRAEDAEAERTGLADMIAQIRKNTAGKEGSSSSNGSILQPLRNHASGRDVAEAASSATDQPKRSASGLWNGTSFSPSSSPSSLHNRKQPNGIITSSSGTTIEKDSPSNLQALERSMATALQSATTTAQSGSGGGREVALQSAPYVSMVGVVLIGVGLMTWLNGWQKVDR